MTKIHASFKNEELGIEARVGEYHKGGFSVVLFDTDADLAVPGAKLIADYDEAVSYAKGLVEG